MKVSVYDTYIPKNATTVMNFDILVEETTSHQNVLLYCREYLHSKGLKDHQVSMEECRYCHMEMAPVEIEMAIKLKGYYIIELENC